MAILNKFLRENKVSKMTKAERNAWYNALSKPEKAVAVCEDVLLQIKNEKYVMTSGTYVQLEFDKDVKQRTINDIIKHEQLDEVISAKSVTCNVCAIGSAFMSCVRLGNAVETEDLLGVNSDNKDYWDDYIVTPGETISGEEKVALDKLSEAFTVKEYRAMEFMFEGQDICDTFDDYNDDTDEYEDSIKLKSAYEVGYKHLTSTEKMIKMCKQIIKDKGYFFVEGVDLENKDK